MVVMFGCLSNYLAVHCYLSGEMIGGTKAAHSAAVIDDARHNDPVLFWIYLSVIAVGALILDLIMIKMLFDWLRPSPSG